MIRNKTEWIGQYKLNYPSIYWKRDLGGDKYVRINFPFVAHRLTCLPLSILIHRLQASNLNAPSYVAYQKRCSQTKLYRKQKPKQPGLQNVAMHARKCVCMGWGQMDAEKTKKVICLFPFRLCHSPLLIVLHLPFICTSSSIRSVAFSFYIFMYSSVSRPLSIYVCLQLQL